MAELLHAGRDRPRPGRGPVELEPARATRSPARCRRRRSSTAIRLVQHVAQVAEESDHHPDIDIRYTTLTFTLSTHSAGGVTAKDLELAGRIDRLVADAFGD